MVRGVRTALRKEHPIEHWSYSPAAWVCNTAWLSLPGSEPPHHSKASRHTAHASPWESRGTTAP